MLSFKFRLTKCALQGDAVEKDVLPTPIADMDDVFAIGDTFGGMVAVHVS